MARLFKGRVLYSNDVICVLFDEEMEMVGDHSIFLVENYSFVGIQGGSINLKDIVKEIFFCNSNYNENLVCFKIKAESKEILKDYKLRFGEILLKDVNYITNRKGEIYGVCESYNINLYDSGMSLRDLKFELLDRYAIGVKSLSEIYIKDLEKTDLIFERNGKLVNIKSIKKESLRYFEVLFNEPIAESAQDLISLRVSEKLEMVNTINILNDPIKRGDKIYIKNTIKASLKKISLVKFFENKVTVQLDFDIDILKYSSNDFNIKINEEDMFVKGHSNYLKKGEPVLLEINNIKGVDVNSPNIYIKTEEISRFFTAGYNKKEINKFSYIKVESFLVDLANLKLDSQAVLEVNFNKSIQTIEEKSIEYTVEEEENCIVLKNLEYGTVNFYYENNIPKISKINLQAYISTKEKELFIKWDIKEFYMFKGFVYADFVSGKKVESYNGIKILQEYNTAIEYDESEDKFLYSRASDFGVNWSFLGLEVNMLTVIEIDDSSLTRVYGSMEKETIFNAGIRLLYVGEKVKEEITVYFKNLKCTNFIIDVIDEVNIIFKGCIINEVKR